MSREMEDITFSYGSGTRTVRVPRENLLEKRCGRKVPPVDVAAELGGKLAALGDSGAWLGERATRQLKVLVLADDYTRPTPTHLILPELFNWLNANGIPDSRIELLVASGFHRNMTRQEKALKYGGQVLERVRVHDHDSLDYENLVCLGETAQGLPVWVNKLVTEADVTIGVGLVEIHPWAGFSGGAKILCPGAAGTESIQWVHALALRPGVETGMVRANPFWESCRDAAAMAGLACVVNVVLDEGQRVVGLFAGSPEQAQHEAIDFFKQVNGVVFPQRADIVITSGNPKHQYWGQAEIAGVNAARVVRKGGVVIVLGECLEGFGDSEEENRFYYEALRKKWDSPIAFWEELMGREGTLSRNAGAVLKHLKLLETADLYFITDGFTEDTSDMESLTVFSDAQEALDAAFDKFGPDATVAAFDMGSMVLPMVEGEQNSR